MELTNYVFDNFKKFMTPAREKQLTLLFNSFHPGDEWEKLLAWLVKDGNSLPAENPIQQIAEELVSARRGKSLYEQVWDAFRYLLNEAERRGYYSKGLTVDFHGKLSQALSNYPLLRMASFNHSRVDEQNWREAVLEYIGFVDDQRRKAKHELATAAIAAGEGSEAIQ